MVLDRSDSVSPIADDVVAGLNEFPPPDIEDGLCLNGRPDRGSSCI